MIKRKQKKKSTKLIQLIYKKHTHTYTILLLYYLRKQNLWIEFKAHNYYSTANYNYKRMKVKKKTQTHKKKNVHKTWLEIYYYTLLINHLAFILLCIWFPLSFQFYMYTYVYVSSNIGENLFDEIYLLKFV